MNQGGEAGVDPSINNIPLPGAALRFRIHNRAFFAGVGRMHSFKKHEISSDQYDDVVVCLRTLRRHKPDRAVAGR